MSEPNVVYDRERMALVTTEAIPADGVIRVSMRDLELAEAAPTVYAMNLMGAILFPPGSMSPELEAACDHLAASLARSRGDPSPAPEPR